MVASVFIQTIYKEKHLDRLDCLTDQLAENSFQTTLSPDFTQIIVGLVETYLTPNNRDQLPMAGEDLEEQGPEETLLRFLHGTAGIPAWLSATNLGKRNFLFRS